MSVFFTAVGVLVDQKDDGLKKKKKKSVPYNLCDVRQGAQLRVPLYI